MMNFRRGLKEKLKYYDDFGKVKKSLIVCGTEYCEDNDIICSSVEYEESDEFHGRNKPIREKEEFTTDEIINFWKIK
jgi:hypothetical protein